MKLARSGTKSSHERDGPKDWSTSQTPRTSFASRDQEPVVVRRRAGGDQATFCNPCVDCGMITGCYCEYCLAECRMPEEAWAPGQCTPLCTKCDRKNDGLCHFCRGVAWVTPQSHGCNFMPRRILPGQSERRSND